MPSTPSIKPTKVSRLLLTKLKSVKYICFQSVNIKAGGLDERAKFGLKERRNTLRKLETLEKKLQCQTTRRLSARCNGKDVK